MSVRWSGGTSDGESSSPPLGPFLSAFEIYLSTSSGKRDMSHEPVACRTTRDLAFAIQPGCCLGTNQSKKMYATATMIRPRANPNRNPRVRSSAPTRLSRILSEIRTVNTDTMTSVARNTPAAVTAEATMSLLMYCWVMGLSLANELSVASVAGSQHEIE